MYQINFQYLKIFFKIQTYLIQQIYVYKKSYFKRYFINKFDGALAEGCFLEFVIKMPSFCSSSISLYFRAQILEIPPKSVFGQIWAKKAIPFYSYFKTYCCFQAYCQFQFHILTFLYTLLLHLTGGSESTKCLDCYFVVYIYSCVLVPVLIKFIFASVCSISTILGFWVWYLFSTYSKNFVEKMTSINRQLCAY